MKEIIQSRLNVKGEPYPETKIEDIFPVKTYAAVAIKEPKMVAKLATIEDDVKVEEPIPAPVPEAAKTKTKTNQKQKAVTVEPPDARPINFLTIGYGGMPSYQSMIEVLDKNKIDLLVDVRSSPRSRKWKKTDLTWDIKELEPLFGARYKHVVELGGLGFEVPQDFEKWKLVANPHLDALIAQVAKNPNMKMAFMCCEMHWNKCHRNNFIGRALRERGYRVENLGVK